MRGTKHREDEKLYQNLSPFSELLVWVLINTFFLLRVVYLYVSLRGNQVSVLAIYR
jgi:hypothetical protein